MARKGHATRILAAMRAWLCVVLACAAACGGNHMSDDDQMGDASIDTPVEPGWTSLIERSWSLGAYNEFHMCRVMKVPEDMYITGYRLVAPAGTHHTILSITNDTTVGNFNCTPASEPTMLYAGGINTNDLVFPAGVAIKLAANQYIRLELHLFNASDSSISGTSGVQIKTAQASEVQHEGDMIFLGNIGNWSLAPTSTPTNIYGSCGAPVDWHLFALWPHMHDYATHQKVTVRRGGSGPIDTLADQDYDVREQKIYGMPDMLIRQFDQLEVTCTYVNDTNVTAPPGYMVYQGDGSTDEMCLTGLLKYPKGGSMYQCAQ